MARFGLAWIGAARHGEDLGGFLSTEILYLTWNRFEFVRVSLTLLLENTNWSLVDRLVIYDDGSTDGTQEWLLEKSESIDVVEVIKRDTNRVEPVEVMNHYVDRTECEWFAKVDSDIACPPHWLEDMLGVVERNPEIELLGMQAGTTGYPGSAGGPGSEWVEENPGFEPASHIGGVGLMKVEAFQTRRKIPAHGRFGFTEWQSRNNLVRGWIIPDLMVPQLDRVPMEPYASLSSEYIAQDWQRHWPVMDARWCGPYYDWLPTEIPA